MNQGKINFVSFYTGQSTNRTQQTENGYSTTQLIACIVNGKVYGDTSAVYVKKDDQALLNQFYLSQNHPNPFNPSTKIKYSLPNLKTPLLSGVGGMLVTLKVYDILGGEIATLVNENQKPGNYEVEFESANLPSGIYFYRLATESFNQTNKMLLLK